MKPKDFKILVRCVEDGVTYGYHRAHKHTDTPYDQELRDQIENAVIDEICEWFHFDESDFYET